MEIIKQLRREKGINQSELSKAIGVSLRTIQLYEKKDANIPMKNLTKIADFFDLSIGELYLNEINESEERYVKNKAYSAYGNIAYRLANNKILLKAPFVMVGLQEELLHKLDNETYSKGLFKIGFVVDTVENTSYMAFEISGDSMKNGAFNSIPNGAIVLGKKVDKQEVFEEAKWGVQPFILICKDRIICKSITAISKTRRTILCHNLNPLPEFRDFEVSMDDVLEVYEVVKKQV